MGEKNHYHEQIVDIEILVGVGKKKHMNTQCKFIVVALFSSICCLHWMRGYNLFPASGVFMCVCVCVVVVVAIFNGPFSFCLFRRTSGIRFPFFLPYPHSSVAPAYACSHRHCHCNTLTAFVSMRVFGWGGFNYFKLIEQQSWSWSYEEDWLS